MPHPSYTGIVHSGHEIICAWAPESGSIPAYAASSYGALPASGNFNFLRLADKPTVDKITGQFQGGAIGTRHPLYDAPGARYVDLSMRSRLSGESSFEFLSNCQLGATDIPNMVLCVGVNQDADNRYSEYHRWTKCTNYALSMGMDSEIVLDSQHRSLGWPQTSLDLDSALVPAYADLKAELAPLQWVNRTQLDINGRAYLGETTAFEIHVNHNIHDDNIRENQGDDVAISRGLWFMKPGEMSIEGTLTLIVRLEYAETIAADNSLRWDDIVIAFDSAPSEAQSATFTLGTVRPQRIVQNGGEVEGGVSFSVPFTARSLTVAYE